MTAVLEAAGLTKRFGSVTAVDDVTFRIDKPGVHGLLGRNGAGKSTLMNLLTGQDFATAGKVRVRGESPLENARAIGEVALIKESQVYPKAYKGKHVLKAASWVFPHWDHAFAARLVDDFAAPLDRRMEKLSRGQRSAIGAVVALASRAEVTLLDEPYAGLDAVARQVFYDHLLEDFAEHPRTVLMSTHLIDEAADLFERVLVIDHGRMVIDASADDLRGTALRVVGRAADVDAVIGSRTVLHREALGGTAAVTVDGADPALRAAATAAGLELAPVSLQQLIVRRTGAFAPEEVAS
ncbi:ABC transporter ATP-binding protein [Demequina capsici]|uniref:ABC transporter ATP-binding protein n=1 Tax=Demequina capsici TaxID=3075620 RepID=A0AA96FEQ4_9MICO|nr:ABC transporter ATP-binding protein [Demequina sp. PMTSA13]WNM28159.1 ABC transporter ATP-binding protein [Demequina sp. PMTSA13]